MNVALTRAELDAIIRPTVMAHGLPNRFYTSTSAARLERDSVLAMTWTCLGFVSDLPSGHAQPVDLMDIHWMMVKNPKGEIHIFHNVCRHRGHRLVADTCWFLPCALRILPRVAVVGD